MPDAINFKDDFKVWSRFTIGFDFYPLFDSMTVFGFYQWKSRLGKRISYALSHGKYETAHGNRIGGYVSDPQNSSLYIGFFRRGEGTESIFDMYWNCLWGITQQIIIPEIILMGHRQANIKMTLAYHDSCGKEDHKYIYL